MFATLIQVHYNLEHSIPRPLKGYAHREAPEWKSLPSAEQLEQYTKDNDAAAGNFIDIYR